jgi:hypothetical protein
MFKLGAAGAGYDLLKSLQVGMDVYNALMGRLPFSEIRWDPADEEVRGRHPRLDAMYDNASRRWGEITEAKSLRRQRRIQELQEEEGQE